MPQKKVKYQANVQFLSDAVLISRQSSLRDLPDISSMPGLAGAKTAENGFPFTRELILRLIDSLKEKDG